MNKIKEFLREQKLTCLERKGVKCRLSTGMRLGDALLMVLMDRHINKGGYNE